MSSFSERHGLKSPREIIQIRSMDNNLRIGLWNAFYKIYKDRVGDRIPGTRTYIGDADSFFREIWSEHYKEPIDDFTSVLLLESIKRRFFQDEWNEVYDFLEFVISTYSNALINNEFIDECNKVLEREKSGYRFLNKQIVQITDTSELISVEKALSLPNNLESVRTHMARATDLLSDRISPDYRNSIKEAVSGLEALCRIIAGKPNATLGDALKQVAPKIDLHPSLKEGILRIYGYTSDAGGIRHSLKDDVVPEAEEAMFMLVTCSSLIHYLISKSEKAGLHILSQPNRKAKQREQPKP